MHTHLHTFLGFNSDSEYAGCRKRHKIQDNIYGQFRDYYVFHFWHTE